MHAPIWPMGLNGWGFEMHMSLLWVRQRGKLRHADLQFRCKDKDLAATVEIAVASAVKM